MRLLKPAIFLLFAFTSAAATAQTEPEDPSRRYEVVGGVLREVVIERDSLEITEEILPKTFEDSVAMLSARQRRRFERRQEEQDSLFRRHNALFRDSIPISKLMWRSVVLPGYSQLYNNQLWKLPVFYGAVGGLVALGLGENGKYLDYRRQYDALMMQNAGRNELDPVQSEMIKYNTARQLLLGAAVAGYIWLLSDGAINYPGATSSVKKATTLSTLLPGAGQVYNRSFWKVPVIVGGFASMAYVIDWNSRGYKRFKLAYEQELNGIESELHNQISQDAMKNYRDSYRRNRDLSIILTAALYLVNIVDAHVDAQLKDYDISDDLSMSVQPAMRSYYMAQRGNVNSYGLTFSLKF